MPIPVHYIIRSQKKATGISKSDDKFPNSCYAKSDALAAQKAKEGIGLILWHRHLKEA